MTLPSARSLSSSASSFVAVCAGWSAMSGVVDTVRLYLRGRMDGGRARMHAVYSGTIAISGEIDYAFSGNDEIDGRRCAGGGHDGCAGAVAGPGRRHDFEARRHAEIASRQRL